MIFYLWMPLPGLVRRHDRDLMALCRPSLPEHRS